MIISNKIISNIINILSLLNKENKLVGLSHMKII